MARLGGEFAVLMLVSMPAEQFAGLDEGLGRLTAQGYKVTTTPAERTYAEAHPGWLPYRIEVQGADHEGIIHEVAHYLSGRGISIESVDSESTPAPTSGSPLFAMTAGLSCRRPGRDGLGGRARRDRRSHEPGHPGLPPPGRKRPCPRAWAAGRVSVASWATGIDRDGIDGSCLADRSRKGRFRRSRRTSITMCDGRPGSRRGGLRRRPGRFLASAVRL